MQNYTKFIPHKANHQQRKHPERIHQQLKKHELLECLIQAQKVMKLTGKPITNIYYLVERESIKAVKRDWLHEMLHTTES